MILRRVTSVAGTLPYIRNVHPVREGRWSLPRKLQHMGQCMRPVHEHQNPLALYDEPTDTPPICCMSDNTRQSSLFSGSVPCMHASWVFPSTDM